MLVLYRRRLLFPRFEGVCITRTGRRRNMLRSCVIIVLSKVPADLRVYFNIIAQCVRKDGLFFVFCFCQQE